MSGNVGKGSGQEIAGEKSSGLDPSHNPGTKVETIKLGSDTSSEELDITTLRNKNRKLAEVIDQRQSIEDELRERIERLVRRQTTDDATLLILNRYWCQFDENVRIVLQRWDLELEFPDSLPEKKLGGPADPEADSEQNRDEKERASREGPTEAVLPFLALLASSSEEEMGLQLRERVTRSRSSLGSALSAFQRIRASIAALTNGLDSPDSTNGVRALEELHSLLLSENNRLRDLTEFLQKRHQVMSAEFDELQECAGRVDERLSDRQTDIEDLQWEADKTRKREQRLTRHLAEILERVKSMGFKVYGSSKLYGGTVTINARKFEEMNCDLEENKELAINRLSELEKLQNELQSVAAENDQTRVDLRTHAGEVVRETPDFRCLQSQFSVLYNETIQVKGQLDDARMLLVSTRSTHQRQLQQMANDELGLQNKLRTEVIQLEDTLAQVRKEYEMLRIEFEQTLAANEQAGPINREMRHLINSLQNHNHQLKGDVQRYKRKVRDSHVELSKLRRKYWDSHSDPVAAPSNIPDAAVRKDPDDPSTKRVKTEEGTSSAEPRALRTREIEPPPVTGAAEERDRERREKEKEKERDKDPERGKGEEGRKREVEVVKQLKMDLKRAQENQKEMKLLLDMYRSSPKEQRDKVQLMAAERKIKGEMEGLRQRLRDVDEREKGEGRKIADVDAIHRLKITNDQMDVMLKKVALAKQEEEALLSEMDVTSQAFEDMQDQNIRLMQQLREKDDANFKLMSERIKSNQIHKLLKEEKEELVDQVLTLQTQVDAQLQVVRKLENTELLLQNNLTTMEKELSVRSQTVELHRRKALEAVQVADDLKLQLDSVQSKLTEVQRDIIDTSVGKEKDNFYFKRTQEDISKLRRKLELQKKTETFTNCDEILMEEIKEYKSKLTCPCCNMRKKDAILTKCFHVFCFECVKTRYDTRQRKCPKCNAAFGANDFHRIYIG